MPDGTIAERLYVRAGARVTNFFFKHPDNRQETLATAPTAHQVKVAEAKAEALAKWAKIRGQADPTGPDRTLRGLFARYFSWQEALPTTSTKKKRESTLDTNRQEAVPLLAFFGDMLPPAVTQQHIYAYIDLRTRQGAPAVCKNEVMLLSAVVKFGIRRGELAVNPCHGVEFEARPPRTRRVTWDEIEFATQVGRSLGGTFHIQALAARAAWLAFKRPGEVLRVPRTGTSPGGQPVGITDDGLVFLANKRRRAQGERTILIRWSPELRATVDEAMALGRWQNFKGDRLIFGNMAGHAYTKSGWGTMWRRFMQECAVRAAWMDRAFATFTLADCRPGGVTRKKERGEDDVYEGTGHVDRRMVDQVYDRREQKTSTPAG